MERRQFLKDAVAIGTLAIGRKIPGRYMRQENSDLATEVEFDIETKTIDYPDRLDFDIKHEEKIFDDLVWEKPSKYQGEGDCDDFAVFILDALDANSYEAVCVGGILEYKKDGVKKEGAHMWTEAKINDTKYIFDVNYKDQFLEKSDASEQIKEITDTKADKIRYKPIKMFGRDGTISPYRRDF